MKVEVDTKTESNDGLVKSFLGTLRGNSHGWIGMHRGGGGTCRGRMGSSKHVAHMTKLKAQRRAKVRQKMASDSRRKNRA